MASTYNSTYTTGGSTSTTNSKSVTAATGKIDPTTQLNFNKYNRDYQESQRVSDAYKGLQTTLSNKPGDFTSKYSPQLDSIYDKITNGEKFKFDVNDSVLYKNMKDQYQALGKLAMTDTMGQAASMTGGYGSSYSQTAGQQSYQNYMQNLNEQIPSIYQMELDKYNSDKNDLYKQFDMTQSLYNNDYNKYRDDVADWQSDRSYWQNAYQSERDFDYNKFSNDRSYWNSEYWNEKNAEQTTTSTSTTNTSSWQNSISIGYSSGGSGGGSSRSSSSSKASSSPSSSKGSKTSKVMSNAGVTNTGSKPISLLTDTQKGNYVSQLKKTDPYSAKALSSVQTITPKVQGADYLYGFTPTSGGYFQTQGTINNILKKYGK